MEILEGVVRHYAWGSTSEIPELLGLAADDRPWAELWLGAHPSAPALVGCHTRPLDQLIESDPEGALGAGVSSRFGTLPFLLKVLSAGAPLSIQAHPSIAQAKAGYEREDSAGIPIDAFNRSFRDRNHKPELICALTRFEALSGFRDPRVTLRLLDTIHTAALDPIRTRLGATQPDRLADLLQWMLTLDAAAGTAIVESTVQACAASQNDEFVDERAMAVELAHGYPGDIGVIIALLLNRVVLSPGEAMFLGAGSLHAYLRGTGVEIMANSDNVLRGGLTPKHIDVPSLLEVVDTRPTRPEIQTPDPSAQITRYRSPVAEFSLTRIMVDRPVEIERGPAILLCTEGCMEIGARTLDKGEAMWLPAHVGSVTADGTGTLFRAGVGQSD